MARCCDKDYHLAHPVQPHKMEELKKWFAAFDQNDDGFISKLELSEAIRNIGQMITEGELDEMIILVDKDGNGLVDFHEFMELMDSNCLVQSADKEVKDLFDAFDLNHDGYITEDEIRDVLKKMCEKVRKREIRKMIKCADTDNDGKISFPEFKEMIENGKFIK